MDAGASVSLVPATAAMIDAELEGADRLGTLLGAAVPPDWPPEHHTGEVLRVTQDALGRPGAAGWWLHYVLMAEDRSATLAGVAGYKGPPTNGVVEIGYSVVPSFQRRGIATAACASLIDAAWGRGAHVVTAQTLPELEPSIGVLRKLRFQPAQSLEPGVLAFELQHKPR
jgi:ribosomal-protein-alanine N-acetyltransferase